VVFFLALSLVLSASAQADTCTWKTLSLLGGPWSTNFNCSGPNGSTYPGQKGPDTASIGLLQLLGNVRVDVPIPFKVALTFDPLLPVGLDIPAGGALILDSGSASNSTSNQITIGGGTLSVASGATIGSFGAKVSLNSGAFNVPGNLSLGTTYSQSGGTMTLVSPGNFGATSMTISGGTVTGSGTLTGNVTNSGGSVSPGSPVGSINVVGNYTQTAAGVVNFDLNGAASAQYDQLNVSGAANLGGTLNAALGYAPGNGDVFNVVNFGSRSADFTTYNLPPIPGPPPGTIQRNFVGSAVQLIAVIPQADLVVTQTASTGSILHNQTATFSVTVTNNGPSLASGITVTNALTGGSFASYSATTASCNGNGADCTIASLGSGATETINLIAKGTAVGAMTNTASASTTSVPDPNLANNSATATVTVNANSDLSAVITAPASVNASSNATFTVTVVNSGPDAVAPAVGFTISGGTLVSSSGAGFACATPASCIGSSLSSGSTATITVVAQAQPQGGSMTLGANAGPLASDPNSSNNSNSRTIAINPLADLQVTKSAAAPLVAGQPASYTITVKNIGPSDAAGVSVSDPAPLGLTFTSNSGACTSPFPCSLGTLAAGSTATITSSYSVAANAASVTNVATVSASTLDTNLSNNSATATGSVTPSSDLAVTETALQSAIFNGQTATFTIVVRNNGPSTASAVAVNNAIAGGAFLSASGVTATCAGANCTIPVLASGQSEIVTLIATANAVGMLSNAATVSAGGSIDAISTNNSATANVTVNGSADLSASVSGPASANAGANVTYTVSITNLGPDPANPTVNLSLTGGTLVSASGAGFTCGTPASCNAMALSSASTRTITVVAQSPAQGGTMMLTASAGPVVSDTNLVNNTASATTAIAAIADLQITKTPPALIAGSTATYTIQVKNAGPSDAAGVSVNDTTPVGMTFVSNSGACATAFPCALGNLAAGSVATIISTYSLSPGAAGPVANVATVSGTTPDPDPTNNSATATGTIIQKADLSVTNVGPSLAGSGTNLTYTITISNNGPSDASNVQLGDPTPARLTFVSATGACTAFPCSLGTMTPSQIRTVQATYTVTPGPTTTIVNVATVSSSTTDLDMTNNASTVITSTGCAASAPAGIAPAANLMNAGVSGTLSWSDVNAASYKIYLGPQGSGCSTLFATSKIPAVRYDNLRAGTTYEWRVEAVTPGCSILSSTCATFTTAAATTSTCATVPPTLTSPLNTIVSGQTTFTWSSVTGARDYQLIVNGSLLTTTTSTSYGPVLVANGPVTWSVVAEFDLSCPSLTSQSGTYTSCDTTSVTPTPSIVAQSDAGQSYRLSWEVVNGATKYEADESTDPDFATVTTFNTTSTSFDFQHPASTPTAFFYRVRAFIPCANAFGPNSVSVRIVLSPVTTPANPNVSAPSGSSTMIPIVVHIAGLTDGSFPFTATLDPQQPWLVRVEPSSGVLTPEGINLTVFADPTALATGTHTGTVTVLLSTPAKGGLVANGTTPINAPVSISLVTPVTPKSSGVPPANALIIPSTGHLDGINSRWASDVRILNTSSQTVHYQITFTPDNVSQGVKQTVIETAAGATTALDDVVKTWYGVGSLGESSNGSVEIRPLDNPAKTGSDDAPNISFTTVASSRTYNAAPTSAAGTLGEFIPAIAFQNFVGKAIDSTHAPTILSLQQIAQNDAMRTNLGVMEASGQPAAVLISVFDSAGKKLLETPLTLLGGQHVQLNGFLAQNKIALNDGRIQVQVAGGAGKVTAYASVIDNKSGDPILISGVPLGQTSADHFVLPGVADLNTGTAAWRTDMRIFNPTSTVQNAQVTFYPVNGLGQRQSTSIGINPGEVKTLDNTLQSLFGLTNTGGAIHVQTTSAQPLVISGRTYNLTSNGTFGQSTTAVTAADAIGKGDKPLQILGTEDSVRQRTNVGVFEVTGHPATVEVTVFLPDSKFAPSTQIPLPANGFVQIPVISSFGLSNIYNARVSMRVVDGDGRIGAYGSVIDQVTQDPTYVPAQQ
jgi:uncharacterized repeat protein (TIGR01451 family)